MTPAFSLCSDIELPPLARQLWAKAGEKPKSLWHHMLDAGLCAAALTNDPRFRSGVLLAADSLEISEEEAKRLIAYLAAVHDCYGKASPGFQKKDDDLSLPFKRADMISLLDDARQFRHERYGAVCYEREAAAFHIPELPARVFASTVRYHHQGKHGNAKEPRKAAEQWRALANALHAAAISVFDPPLQSLRDECRDCSAAVMALMPFVILSDWLASSEPFSALDEEMGDSAYLAASRSLAENVVARYGLASKTVFPTVDRYGQLWPGWTEETLRPVQRTVLRDADPGAGLTLVEAPMGEGKTEAGAFQAARLCGLWHKQGIYFALPTAATSNQMHGRMEKMLAALHMGGPRLMHGMAWLAAPESQAPFVLEGDDGQAAYDWLRPLRRAMLAESAVGTVDQAMMAVMPIRYSCLRLLGLTGKVLVMDEIHAYDAYMSTIIDCLLAWCRTMRIPVVLLSATLPREKREALIRAYGGSPEGMSDAYPLVTQVSDGKTRQIPVDGCAKTGVYHFRPLRLWNDPDAIAARAVKKVENGGCLCVMMNTVAGAQAVWRAVREAADGDTEVILFHARFKARVRDGIERRCIRLFGKDAAERPAKAILVCTQVVEQSLDVDFDGMITEIAPIDLLLQRAGRVHRHDRGKRPEGMEDAVMEVLVPEGAEYGAAGAVYAPWLLRQTQSLLPQTVRIPNDVRRVIEAVYAQPGDVPEEWAKMMFADQGKEARAKANMLDMPDPRTFFGWERQDENFSMEEPEEDTAARTRLENCSVRAALLPEAEIRRILDHPRDADLARHAFENSFTVREKMPDVPDPGAFRMGSGLTNGLLLVSEEALPVRIGRTRLDYDADLGAVTERMRCE